MNELLNKFIFIMHHGYTGASARIMRLTSFFMIISAAFNGISIAFVYIVQARMLDLD